MNKEENRIEPYEPKSMGNSGNEYIVDNEDSNDNFFMKLMKRLAHYDDRLVYIYIFTAIIVATVITTLFRSIIFFNVSIC